MDQFSDFSLVMVRYLSHKLDDLAWRINRRISSALQLDLNGLPIPGENFQLMDYGIGKILYCK